MEDDSKQAWILQMLAACLDCLMPGSDLPKQLDELAEQRWDLQVVLDRLSAIEGAPGLGAVAFGLVVRAKMALVDPEVIPSFSAAADKVLGTGHPPEAA